MKELLRILNGRFLSLKLGQQLRCKSNATPVKARASIKQTSATGVQQQHFPNPACHQKFSSHPTADKSASYQDVLFDSLKQAHHSVLLQVHATPNYDSNLLYDQVYNYCSQKGSVLYLGVLQNDPKLKVKQFIVEFADSAALNGFSLANAPNSFRVRVAQLNPTNLKLQCATSNPEDPAQLHGKFIQKLKNAENMSEQMILFHQYASLSPEAVRARFFFATVVEDFINWHFNLDMMAVPFGTTYYGLATSDSDLDISLSNVSSGSSASSLKTLTQLPLKSAGRYNELLRSGSYQLLSSAEREIQKQISGLADVSCLDALVPILKMTYLPLRLNVDLSLENRIGMKMSFCLNMYYRMDERVAPFLFLLRTWGRQRHIVSKPESGMYEGLTSFMLTCIGLFYLMRVNPCVLPSLRQLMTSKPASNDLFLGDFRCQLHKNIGSFPASENTSSVEELFMGFLEYVAKLDFAKWGLTLTGGRVVPNYSQLLLIFVPFSGRNVGKICSVGAMTTLNKEAAATLRKLEFRRRRSKRYDEWGLLSILDI